MPTIDISLNSSPKNTINGTVCQSRVCGHKVEGIDCGSEVSEWLSSALGVPNLRLIRQNDNDNRKKGIFHNIKLQRFCFLIYNCILLLQRIVKLNYHSLAKLNI